MNLKVPDRLKNLKIVHKNLLIYAVLVCIVLLAVALRLLPLQWGVYLDEFDPYIQYKGAEYIVQNGFNAWYSWFDPTRWAPWGAAQGSTALLGVPFTGAALYMFLNFVGLNIQLFDLAAFFPIFSGAIMVLLVFAIGKELVSRNVGLFAAFIFAIDLTAIQRTSLGFFDTESAGMLGLFVAVLFFIKSLKSKTIPYSIIAGLGLAYMAISWGAYLYPLNLFALFAIIMAIIGRWSKQLSISTTVITAITIFTLAVTPNYGLDDAISPFTVLPIMAFIVCLVLSFSEYVKDPAKRKTFSIGAILGIVVVIGALTLSGVFGPITGKFLTFINPFSRAGSPIIGTVGEQFPAIWANFFTYYHILLILAPVGVYYALRRLKYKDLFVVLFALTALYGAGTYIRLMVVVAPAIAILGGLALSSLFSNISIYKQQPERKSRASFLSRGYGILIIAIVIVAMVPLVNNLSAANRPVMIVSSSSGYAAYIPDWMEALSWMRDNLPSDTIVGCWWDYGYWINVMANKSVIADNSTTNGTQIKLIAEAFLNNETYALEIFKAMNVEYVVVYEPWTIVSRDPLIGLPPWTTNGDFEKSTAMMSIAGYNSSDYIQGVQLTISSTQTITWPLPAGSKAANTTLYQLLFYPFISGYNSTLSLKITAPKHFQLAYASSDLWVLVYKINYPA